MFVTKRDNTREEISFDKITSRIKQLCSDLDRVKVHNISLKTINNIYDGITTSELDVVSANICATLASSDYQYNQLGARILVSSAQKNIKVLLGNNDTFVGRMNYVQENYNKLYNRDYLIPDLVKYMNDNSEFLNKLIDYSNDFSFEFFGYKTLEKSYLIKFDDKPVESPQDLFLRVAVAIHYLQDNKDLIQKTYEFISKGYFTHATPTLFNAGVINGQYASCFLLGTDDSIEGMYKNVADCAKISKGAGGIGVHISNVRAKNSIIKGSNGRSNGIIKLLKVLNETSRHVTQGGKRAGSFAIYLEPWHADVKDFLEIKKQTGADSERCRDLFSALWVPDLFMKAVTEDSDWYLMSPDECPRLNETYGKEFEDLYNKYVSEGKYREKVKALDIWERTLVSQIETGVPYIAFKDRVNERCNQKNIGIVKSSNLCCEITEVSDLNTHSVCNLASIAVNKFYEDGVYNYDKLREVAKLATVNLNRVIDINAYPTLESKETNFAHRPIGVGIQGLADLFCMMKIPFESEEAIKIDGKIMEHIYYGCVEGSIEMAERDGSYKYFEGSPYSKGILQFDFDERGQSKLSSNLDWINLKERMQKSGMRNSLLTALMPTASTSQILGNNECFSGDTQVTLANGTMVAIKNIRPGDSIVAYSENDKGMTTSKVTEFLPRGEKEVVRLTFKDGRTLTCTPDHKFLLANGKWCKTCDIPLKSEPVMLALTGTPDIVGDDETNWELKTVAGSFRMSDNRNKVLTLARVVGFIRADGSIQSGKVTAVFGHPIDRDRFLTDIIDILNGQATWRVTDSGCYEVIINGTIASVIRNIDGMVCGSRVANPVTWPTFVLADDCPMSVRREFLAGFFGGDGWTPVLVNNSNQTKTFSPIRLSQTACMNHSDSLIKAMNQLCELLTKTGVPGAQIINIRNIKNIGNKPYRCGEKEHVCVRIGFPINAFTQHLFVDKIGIRYSVHKEHRYGIVASWSRYLNEIKRQYDLVCTLAETFAEHSTLTQGLSKAIEELKKTEPILNEHYSTPTITQLYDRNKRETKEIKQFKFKNIISPEQFLDMVGAREWFAHNNENEKTNNKHTYAVDIKSSVTPTMHIQLIDRRPAGIVNVYDINVDKLHNFVANGAVVHNCFEPYTSNIYTRSTQAGEFIMINKHLIKDLIDLKIWDNDMREQIIINNGSVQDIEGIPNNLKEIYKTVWEIKQKSIIDHSVVRGYFTDQSQSQNLFFPEPDTKKLSSALIYGWKQGLKTGMYYLRSKPATSALKFTIDANKVKADERRKDAEKKKKTYVCNDEEGICVMCSS
jgi:ribonucleoside-diphosphate reductase alpha chain